MPMIQAGRSRDGGRMDAADHRDRLRRHAMVAATILVLVHGGSRSLDAQTADRWPPHSPIASIEVGDGVLDVRFPPIPLSDLGCRDGSPTDSVHFAWGTFQNFADAQPPHGHNMAITAWFRLPGAPPLTEARLDSALARARIELFELPRGTSEQAPPMRNAWVRREGDRIHLRVENDSVVAAFMTARADWGAVQWCASDATGGIIAVPIDRH
jgi:hypothetical protein